MQPLDDSALPPTCVVVVNWNGWRDTIACLESLLALAAPPMRVVVCDNGSTDESVAQLDRYLRERLPHWEPAAGQPGLQNPQPGQGVRSVHLLRLQENLGYAGALNAGIAWARERWSPRGFWLLNNDVQAQPGALEALVAAHASVPHAGVCGSVLMEWDAPDRIQGVAGVYRRWLGVGWHDKGAPAGKDVKLDVDYPIGASMYVATDYLNEVGPMDPGYFLYCEEMDWAERGRRHGYRPVVALRSRLRHKEGASTGSRGGVRNKSLLSERHGVISRLRITRKFWPHWLPVVWCSLLLVVLDRLLHGETARAGLVLRLMFSPSLWLRDPGGAAPAPRLAPLFEAIDRKGYLDASNRALLAQACRRDSDILASHPGRAFHLQRFCLCCNRTTRMRVDYASSYAQENGKSIPNWRERLVCGRCRMNNRQRLVASLVRQSLVTGRRSTIYLMEQVTPIFEWVSNLPATEVHGSEYLGPGYKGGERVRGLRHEDVMNLSYPDASFELVVSNDVMEHIPDPARALQECFRVLKPGGAMLATFPFHVESDTTVVRARLAGDGIEHLLPPQYHGNPVSSDGSLVFHDFGWDLLDAMKDTGFAPAACEVYSSDEFGHLGAALLVFRLSKPQPASPA